MSLISVIVILIVVGVLLYFLQTAPFIDGQMKQVIRWLVIIVVVLWLLSIAQILPDLGSIRVGR